MMHSNAILKSRKLQHNEKPTFNLLSVFPELCTENPPLIFLAFKSACHDFPNKIHFKLAFRFFKLSHISYELNTERVTFQSCYQVNL